jgi:hypothetical protein
LKIKLYFTFILSLTFSCSFGQFFDESQSPLSVKWREINHQGFKIIYSAQLEKDAQKLSNTLPHIYPALGRDLKQLKTRIPIVLQNLGTTANGFVQLAPKKSELYTISPQQFDSQDWLNNLAIHELRHIIQYNKYTGKTGFPFPEEIYFGYLGLSSPTWFLEGDAVSTETNHTYSGRGRQPAWIMAYRTALLEGQKMSYSKAYFGSQKNITPGYYQLGYLMSAHLQKNEGSDITEKIISDISRRPLRFYPFSQSLKKFTNKNTKRYFEHVQRSLEKDWKEQAKKTEFKHYESLNKKAKYATNYHLPTPLPNGKILALKSSKSEPSNFVVIDTEKSEKSILKIAYQEMPWFSFGNQKIVWDEYREDARYKQRSWNVICIYDLEKKQKIQLTKKSRLFAPSISADGQKIVAVKIDLSNKHQLVFIDPKSGEITDSIPNSENHALQTPSLNADGSQVAWVSVTEEGKSMWLAHDGKIEQLIGNTRQQISRPVFFQDRIAFNAHYSGVDNVYEITPQAKKINALTAAKYGAFNPSFDSSNNLYFSEYQNMGFEIAKTEIEPMDIRDNNFVYYGKQTTPENYVFADIPDSTFQSKPYSPLKHALNFHSISPIAEGDLDKVGLELKSNDLLNTTSFYTGVSYQSSNRNIEYYAGLKYRALYPIINLAYRNRPRVANYRFQNAIHQAQWREDYFGITASVPLSFNAYNHQFSFIAETGTYLVNRHFNKVDAPRLVNRIQFPLSHRLGFSHRVRTAERDIAPKWAQLIEITLQNTPFDDRLNGQLLGFESYFYFPGLAKNHSFLVSYSHQKNSGTFANTNAIETVFGYKQIKAISPLKSTLLLNYRFPFLFPDLEIGPIAYVRNLRATFFSHYENIGSQTKINQPKTYGLELRSSMNLLRYQPVADIGARLIFVDKNYKQNPIFELLFNYNF